MAAAPVELERLSGVVMEALMAAARNPTPRAAGVELPLRYFEAR